MRTPRDQRSLQCIVPTPRLSIVVPTYNVAAYLPAFLESLRRQTLPLDQLEIVFVNDGSTDDSEEIIRAWTAEHASHATVLSKPNGGLASARNTGLDVARGEWITFCDPDDEFNRDYFRTVLDFVASADAARVQLVATRLLILDDATGAVTDTHPLGFKFRHGRRVVDLTDEPSWIHLQAASAFLRRERLVELGLRFDDAVRPNFEDSFLITLYLAAHERPALAVLPAAQYRYRHRADGTSLVQSSWAKPEKYTVLPEVGYLRLLQMLHERLGRVPEWAQNVVLYDLFFYFRTDGRSHSPTAALPREVTETFLDLVARIAALLDPDVVERYAVWQPKHELVAVLTQGVRDGPVPHAVLGPRDGEQLLVRLRYFVRGDLPREVFTVGGDTVAPVHAKIRSVDYFGRTLLSERIVWLPSPDAAARVTVRLDDRDVPVQPDREPPAPRPRRAARSRLQRVRTIAEHVAERVRADPALLRQRAHDLAVRVRARRRAARERYRDAWLLVDRDSSAQDNAEHLYRHLRAHEPDVNAFFVLRRDSSDWNRLHREGFRLLEFGTTEYFVAVLHCAHIVSSQIDHYVAAPTAGRRLRKSGWRLTFLQHGVTKDDLSRWINRKPLDLMVTVTPDEQHSIAGDHTPYVFTTREIRMTGFPRHDRLLELGRPAHRRPPAARHADLAPRAARRHDGGRQRPRPRPRLLGHRLCPAVA